MIRVAVYRLRVMFSREFPFRLLIALVVFAYIIISKFMGFDVLFILCSKICVRFSFEGFVGYFVVRVFFTAFGDQASVGLTEWLDISGLLIICLHADPAAFVQITFLLDFEGVFELAG